MRHISEDLLDQHAPKKLSDAEAAALEKHLLIRPDCQDRLQLTEDWTSSRRCGPQSVTARMAVVDCDRGKAVVSRLAVAILVVLSCATVGYSQAAVEYALKSAGSAVSGSGTGAAIGGCRVDSTVLTCLSRSYPKTFIIVIGILVVILLWWLAKAYTSRR